MTNDLWQQGYNDAWEALSPQMPNNTAYMNGYYEAEDEMDEEELENEIQEVEF